METDTVQNVVVEGDVCFRESESRESEIVTVKSSSNKTKNSKIVAFVNSKSGGMKGKQVLLALKASFGDEFVFDLFSQSPPGPTPGLLATCSSEDTNIKVLVCGGDGTVQWILSDIEKLLTEGKLTVRPPVSILPLGTGNDLARQLSWGHAFSKSMLSTIRKDIDRANTHLVDRWLVTIVSVNPTTKTEETFVHSLINYLGVGVDAKVVKNFENCRTHYPGLYCCRAANNGIYGWFGLTNCCRSPYSLDRDAQLQVFVDDSPSPTDLPSGTQGFTLHNVQSYMGGINMWGESNPLSADIADGKLEMCSVSGAFHLGRIKGGLGSPNRLGQCKKTVIKAVGALQAIHVQVDGEAFVFAAPLSIEVIKAEHPALMLVGSEPDPHMFHMCC